MQKRVLQSMRSLATGLAIALVGAVPADAQHLNLEFHLPTGENPFSRYVWLCPDCDLADWAAATPAPGFEQVPPRLALFDSARFVPPTPPPGVPAALDFVPTLPGAESIYVAKVRDATILGFDPTFQVLALAHVQRDTRLLFEPGTVVHQLMDPGGDTFTLFTFDLLVSGLVDPTQVGTLAGFPLPPGWSYSSHVLTSDLLLVSDGLASVFVQGGAASWQRQETVYVGVTVKPGDAPEVHPGSRGMVPVAILGDVDFDVTTIDTATLTLGAGAAPAHAAGGHVEQVDGDGIPDLVSHYRVDDVGIEPGDAEVCVSGQTLEGVAIGGCAAIVTVP